MELSRLATRSALVLLTPLALLAVFSAPAHAGTSTINPAAGGSLQALPADRLPSALHISARPISLRPSPLRDDVSSASAEEGVAVLTNNAQYRALFGHGAPAEVDWSRQWVAFYSAGLYLSGGFSASIEAVQYNPAARSLWISTLLFVPGEGCIESEELCWPHALATFPRPSGDVALLWIDRQAAFVDCGS